MKFIVATLAVLLAPPLHAQEADEAALRASLQVQVGEWQGTYTEVDATDGSIIQQFTSHIESRLEGDTFYQTVTHSFSDGRDETTDYVANIVDGELVYPEASNLHGEVYKVATDTTVFDARYRDDDSKRYLESIVISEDRKTRVINTFENGVIKMFTLIVEERVK